MWSIINYYYINILRHTPTAKLSRRRNNSVYSAYIRLLLAYYYCYCCY